VALTLISIPVIVFNVFSGKVRIGLKLASRERRCSLSSSQPSMFLTPLLRLRP
jgi:hypothetical protein